MEDFALAPLDEVAAITAPTSRKQSVAYRETPRPQLAEVEAQEYRSVVAIISE
jgi:hypothetical protein